MGLSIYDEHVATTFPQQWVAADTTTKKSIYVAGYNGGRLDAVIACTDSVSPVQVGFYRDSGGTQLISILTVPAGAGQGTTPAVDLMSLLPTTLVAGLTVTGPSYLWAAPIATMSGTDTLWLDCMGGDF